MKKASQTFSPKQPVYKATALMILVFAMTGCADSQAHLTSGIHGPDTLEAGTGGSYTFYSPSPSGYPLSYGVNWGDGTSPSNSLNVPSGDDFEASHTWTQSGSRTIMLTVTDGHGNSSMATREIQVTNPPPAE